MPSDRERPVSAAAFWVIVVCVGIVVLWIVEQLHEGVVTLREVLP